MLFPTSHAWTPLQRLLIIGAGLVAAALCGTLVYVYDSYEQELLEHRLIRRAVIDAERGAVLRLRERGELNDEVWRRIERDLDLEELRMEA